jgi:hypothetical protein
MVSNNRFLGYRGFEICSYLLLSIAVVVLSFVNLETYPLTWFDEGEYLQASQNIALHGKYALRSSEGFRMFDPALNVGPTVLLPIALVFKLFGVGLLQGRLVMAVYLVLTVWVFFLTTSHIYNRKTALVASFLFIMVADDVSTSPLFLGRQVMGEVPGLLFFLLGSLWWFKSLKKNHYRYSLLLSGLFFGLSMLTKDVYLLFVPSAMVFLWIVDRLFYKRATHRHFVIPVAIGVSCIVLWYVFRLVILGPSEFISHIAVLRSASSYYAGTFSLQSILYSIKFLSRPYFLMFGLPSLLYALLLAIQRRPSNLEQLFLLVFIAGWSAWYVFGSIGWYRYVFPPLALTNLFVANLFHDVTHGFDLSLMRVWEGIKTGKAIGPVKNLSVMLLLSFLILNPRNDVLKGLFSAQDRSPQEFAEYINANVEEDALIESWEWEIGFLTGRTYHYPPTSMIPTKVKQWYYSGDPYDPDLYDFQQYAPDYIVVGYFAGWSGLYPPDFLAQECTLVKSIPVTTGYYGNIFRVDFDYELYRVNVSKAAQSVSGRR